MSSETNGVSGKTLGMFSIVMITITSVDSIRNLPATALFGSAMVFFFIIAAIFFLLPSAMVSAELASAWPKTGGIYIWVREAFGERYGFLAIWFQWIENVIWYPTILSFVAGTFAFLISPNLAGNKFYLAAVIVGTFWLLTIINMAGIKSSARFASFFGITGLVLPMSLIIILGAIWALMGKPEAIDLHPSHLIPDLADPNLIVALTGVVLCFCGMEIATVHAQDVENPERNYPRAMLYSVLFIFITMLLGSLSIAIVVPSAQLSLVAGIMQAFKAFFIADHIPWMTPIIAVFLIIGCLGGISNWVIAPNRGLMIALRDAGLGKSLQKENHHGAPTALLLYQGILVTILASVFLFMPSVNSSYWILTALTAQLYMGMYLLMFAAAIRLRYKHPEVKRTYKLPGGKFGLWLIAGMGFFISLFTIGIGFFPPESLGIHDVIRYEITLTIGLVAMTLPPFVLYWLKNRFR